MDRKSAVSEIEKDVNGFMANDRLNRIANYATRGRRFKSLTHRKLNEVWIAAYKEMATWPGDPVRWQTVKDLDAEFELRGREQPYHCVLQHMDHYIRAIRSAYTAMTAEERAAANRDLQRDIDDFKSRRDEPKN